MQRITASLVLALAACSSGGSSVTTSAGGAPMAATSGSTAARAATRRSPNIITSAEIAEFGQGLDNAYDVIERLRPSMLRVRAVTSIGQGTAAGGLVARVDETLLGDVSNLRQIAALQIKEIILWSASDATQKWGTGYTAGAVQVITKR